MTTNELEMQIERDMDSRYGYYMVNGNWPGAEPDEEEEETPYCEMCAGWYDDDVDMPEIRYRSFGIVRTICADCFFKMIGWKEAMQIPCDICDEDILYDEALFILRNMIDKKVGHPSLDDHRAELLAVLERIVALTEQVEAEKGSLTDLKQGA